MKEALFYEETSDGKVICRLCPHNCIIKEGHSGICKVRVNSKGKLYSTIYGQVSAIHTDPIEKKPLYHFSPGKSILSVGSIGCNFKCSFCQNYSISQSSPESYNHLRETDPTEIVGRALTENNNIGIAYTYNEPTIFYEMMLECASLAKLKGLKNVVVSNGFINHAPLVKILPYIDAFNIDLKAFNNDFYKKHTKGSLNPVLKTLKTIAGSGKHLEITFLAIPGLNDDKAEFREMVIWISKKLGKNTPLHISRYFPAYKQTKNATPVSTLKNFYDIAAEFLNFVFLGNIFDAERSATYCPKCKKALIKRERYFVNTELLNHSECLFCGVETGIII